MMTTPTPISAIVTAADLLKAYAAGQLSFVGLVLSEADLSDVDLKGTDLSYADLSGSDLSGANLRGVDLSYANLSEANLTNTDLRGAMLIGTNLRTAVMAGTQLKAADYDPEETQFPKGFDPAQAELKADR